MCSPESICPLRMFKSFRIVRRETTWHQTSAAFFLHRGSQSHNYLVHSRAAGRLEHAMTTRFSFQNLFCTRTQFNGSCKACWNTQHLLALKMKEHYFSTRFLYHALQGWSGDFFLMQSSITIPEHFGIRLLCHQHISKTWQHIWRSLIAYLKKNCRLFGAWSMHNTRHTQLLT